PTFHKIVGLNDKITIAEYKEGRPKKEPGETLPTSNSQSPEPNNK
ncbi:32791_t:CDS:1, partial [Racocetra persica]